MIAVHIIHMISSAIYCCFSQQYLRCCFLTYDMVVVYASSAVLSPHPSMLYHMKQTDSSIPFQPSKLLCPQGKIASVVRKHMHVGAQACLTDSYAAYHTVGQEQTDEALPDLCVLFGIFQQVIFF